MLSPELIVLCLNIVVISIAYFVVYPKFCGANGNKIASNDLIATSIVLLTSGSIFWGSDETFSMLLFSVNWFWFTLLTYAEIEIPIMLWYFNKHDVWASFNI